MKNKIRDRTNGMDNGMDREKYYEQGVNNTLAKIQELLQSDKSDAEVIEQLIQLCGIQQEDDG